jgi:PTS system mannose-specific IID component
MTESRGIRRGDLIRVLLRSFLIQASWSFDRMQSLGFAFAIRPALRRLYPKADEYNSRLRLHMEYFNTQPYLASFILGAAVRMEEDRAAGSGGTVDVPGLKNNLMAPLGALGDSFFWGALKPLAALIAVSLLMAGAGWAPVLFLAVYNAWHLRLRTSVLFWGYESGGDVVRLLSHYSFTRMASLFKALSLAVLGGMLGMIPMWRPEFKPLPGAAGVVAGVAATLVLVVAARKGFSPVKLMFGLAAISVALTYAGVA